MRKEAAKHRGDNPNLVINSASQIAEGLARGLTFVQWSSCSSQEKAWVDELIAQGKARGFWSFVDGGETNRMIRLVRRKGDGPKLKPSDYWLEEHREWIWERSLKPSIFLLRLFNDSLNNWHRRRRRGSHGGLALGAIWIGYWLRRQARESGQYPTPFTLNFLYDLAAGEARFYAQFGYRGFRWYNDFRRTSLPLIFRRIMSRVEEPLKPVERYAHISDELLAWHGIAPLPEIIGEKHWSKFLPNWEPSPPRQHLTGGA
jgi:hypothetical protein